MRRKIMRSLATLFLVAALGVSATAAFAQQSTTTKSDKGAASSIPAGQGGTAGTHDSGPHASPSRAGQVKTPGN
jgi:pectate lyase